MSEVAALRDASVLYPAFHLIIVKRCKDRYIASMSYENLFKMYFHLWNYKIK